MGVGAFMVCFFHLRRSRCPDCDRAAYCAQAVVHLCDGFRRDIDRDGAVRRQLGSVPGVFWSGFDSLGTGDHFRGMSRNVGCGRRADPADSSAFRSNHDASRRPDFSGGADDHSGRSPVRIGGKTQRSRLATGERQHTTGFLVGIFTGFCFGHPWLDAGFLPGAIYCYILMRKKGNVSQLRLPGTWYYWFAAASMGLLWYGSIILYSISTVKLGALGTSIGWPLFLASIVVASTVFGALTGEWARTGTRPIRTMIVGVSFLVLAIAILSYAGRA